MAEVARPVALYLSERFPVAIGVALALVLSAATLSRGSLASLPALTIVAWLLLFGGRAYDDLADLPRDRLRRPGRGLSSGRIPAGTLRSAGLTAWFLALCGSALLSIRTGGMVLLHLGIAVLFYATRRSLPAAAGPVVVNLVFPVAVLLGPVTRGRGLGTGVLLAVFVWLGSIAHDFAHSIEEEALPGALRDPLPPKAHAWWGACCFLGSLLAAVAYAGSTGDLLFAAGALSGALVTGWRLLTLLREPWERNAAALRIPAFLYFVVPLVGSSIWGLLS